MVIHVVILWESKDLLVNYQWLVYTLAVTRTSHRHDIEQLEYSYRLRLIVSLWHYAAPWIMAVLAIWFAIILFKAIRWYRSLSNLIKKQVWHLDSIPACSIELSTWDIFFLYRKRGRPTTFRQPPKLPQNEIFNSLVSAGDVPLKISFQ